MNSGFRIGGFRHNFLEQLKNRLGGRNYRIVGIALLTTVVGITAISLVLSMDQEESFASENNLESVVDIRFLNTQTGSGLSGPYYDANKGGNYYKGNQSNLIKTKDGKYVLIDTGNDDSEIRSRIKKALNKDNPVIDYLVVSHLDKDHFGNAAKLINNDNIKVKNVIIKYEGGFMSSNDNKKDAYDNIVRAAKKEGANLYTNASGHKVDGVAVSDYKKYKKMTTEGTGNAKIAVGDYLTLYFYNTRDVYHDQDCSKKGYYTRLTSTPIDSDVKKFLIKDSSNYYQVLDNSGGAYPSLSYTKTKTLKDNSEAVFNKVYYRYLAVGDDNQVKTAPLCRSNSNSYGVLAEIKTDAGNKYAYFPNDIDNFGYDVKPTNTDVTYYSVQQGKEVTKKVNVYGNGVGMLYKKGTVSSVLNNERLGASTKVYSESKVALEIADKLGNNKSNIVIYQIGHHGGNNAPDAVNTLGVNRSNVYAINNRGTSIKNASSFQFSRTYRYTLSNAKKMFSGYNKGNGVFCKITNDGNTKCSYNEIKINTLTYNMNGGSGSIASQTCMGDSACSLKIVTTQPSRNNYVFLGWAKSASATSAIYKASNSIEISSDTTLYAIWAPVYSLSYNTNNGVGTFNAQTCSPTTTTGSCSLVVSSNTPTRDGYAFKGWGISESSTNVSYVSGNNITIKKNTILYAVWERLINITTSVNGVGGTITPSISNLPKGRTVTIKFIPYSGYEIDNVKVNGESTEVANNELLLITDDVDINVVVTYRTISGGGDEPIQPETKTFYMVFSPVNGGTGFPNTISCTTVAGGPEQCSVTIPSNIPTRSGYVFLGYGLLSDNNTVVYLPGNSYVLTDNVYTIGIWAPIYTLSYDLNGGMVGGSSVIDSQTCNSISANSACSVVLTMSKPTLDNHEFFGWSTDAESSIPEYLPGDTFNFSVGVNNITLYAIWSDGGVEWQQGQNYVVGSEVDLILKIENPLESFESLFIDDVEVDSTNYTLSFGSTIITINSEFADTLETKTHTLQAKYHNGVVVGTTFTTMREGASTDESDTGIEKDWDEMMDGQDEYEYSSSNLDGDDILVPNTGDNTENNIGGNMSMIMIMPILVVIYYSFRRFVVKNRSFGFEKHKD